MRAPVKRRNTKIRLVWQRTYWEVARPYEEVTNGLRTSRNTDQIPHESSATTYIPMILLIYITWYLACERSAALKSTVVGRRKIWKYEIAVFDVWWLGFDLARQPVSRHVVVVVVVVVVVFTLTHGYNAVRRHRTGSNNSGAEDYLRRENKQKTEDNNIITEQIVYLRQNKKVRSAYVSMIC